MGGGAGEHLTDERLNKQALNSTPSGAGRVGGYNPCRSLLLPQQCTSLRIPRETQLSTIREIPMDVYTPHGRGGRKNLTLSAKEYSKVAKPMLLCNID